MSCSMLRSLVSLLYISPSAAFSPVLQNSIFMMFVTRRVASVQIFHQISPVFASVSHLLRVKSSNEQVAEAAVTDSWRGKAPSEQSDKKIEKITHWKKMFQLLLTHLSAENKAAFIFLLRSLSGSLQLYMWNLCLMHVEEEEGLRFLLWVSFNIIRSKLSGAAAWTDSQLLIFILNFKKKKKLPGGSSVYHCHQHHLTLYLSFMTQRRSISGPDAVQHPHPCW